MVRSWCSSPENLLLITKRRLEGWRLCVSRAGTTFTKYFSDKAFGSGNQSLKAAEVARTRLLKLIDNSRRINGKLSKSTVERAHQILRNG